MELVSPSFFLIPFCFSAYRRSLAGMLVSVFLLFTSMFWFPKPDNISAEVQAFLQFEINWLKSPWVAAKIFSVILVPLSFVMLAIAFWKRSMLYGLSVLGFMAFGKILWAVVSAGSSGKSIVIPAVAGLAACFVLIYFGLNKAERTK